jgi:signal transduction histidine kinase
MTVEPLLLSIVAAIVCGAAATALLFAISRHSVPWAIRLAPLVPVSSVAAGVATASETMLLEADQVVVIAVVLLVATPIAVAFGAVVGARVARLQAEAAAQQRDRAIEERRTELIAWLGHDLRTPLARMRVLTEALEDGLAPEDYPTRMLREVDSLGLIVEDLTTMSRLQSPAARMAREPVDLGDLASDLVGGNQPLAHRLGITLDGSVDGPVIVQGDTKELGRAVNNLIVNALRHTRPEGFVAVSVDHDLTRARLSVRDQCGGIPDGHLQRVFEPGWRGTTSRTPGDGGAGLGLTISQRVVQGHAGTITVHNSGDGCTFVIEVPLATESPVFS